MRSIKAVLNSGPNLVRDGWAHGGAGIQPGALLCSKVSAPGTPRWHGPFACRCSNSLIGEQIAFAVPALPATTRVVSTGREGLNRLCRTRQVVDLTALTRNFTASDPLVPAQQHTLPEKRCRLTLNH